MTCKALRLNRVKTLEGWDEVFSLGRIIIYIEGRNKSGKIFTEFTDKEKREGKSIMKLCLWSL